MTNFRKKKIAGEEQQLYDDKGKFVGVQYVDTDGIENAGSWVAVDIVVRDYATINPIEVREIVEENALTRVNNKYGTGAMHSKTARHAVSVPVGLMHKLEAVMPDIFTNKKKLHHFMKCYKGFTTCEVI